MDNLEKSVEREFRHVYYFMIMIIVLVAAATFMTMFRISELREHHRQEVTKMVIEGHLYYAIGNDLSTLEHSKNCPNDGRPN